MYRSLMHSVKATVVLVVILCGAYPLLITGLGQLLFHDQATGSLVTNKDGKVIGSKLIGQSFTKPEYFHGRPSSAGNGYDAANSSGSNLGPTNQKLADAWKANAEAVLRENPSIKKGEIPSDLITTSASGLDPHISPEGAMAQVDRVATARQIPAEKVRELVRAHTERPQLGILGEQVVNVLALNIALDELKN